MIERAAGFLEACGSVGPLILGVDEPGSSAPSWRVLDQPFAIVGRSPEADLFLNEPAVSRRHAYIQLIGGRVFCIDLDSRTGTRWGSEAGVWGWLDPKAGVGIGPFAVRSRNEAPGSPLQTGLPTSRSFAPPDLAEITLEISGRTNGPRIWRVSRALTLIGSASGCRIRLDGGRIASIHASLVRTPTGIFAVDLLGPGGICRNGERVGCARLNPGDELTIGPHRIRVRPNSTQLEPDGQGATALPAPVATGGGVESLARALCDEFGRSHDRATDRLQDTLVAILESIAGIHREQMALIGEELARIRHLTEAQAIQSRTDQQAAARPTRLRLVAGGPGADKPSRRTPVDLPRRRTGEGRPVDSPTPAPRPAAPPPSVLDEADFHARVFDRLTEARGEGSSQWRRLVESLLGRGHGPNSRDT